MSPKRVLLMASSMRGGGSEQQTLLLLRHLDRSRFDPHLYLTQRTGDLLDSVPEDITIHTFEDADLNAGWYFPGKALRRQVRHLEDVIARASIDVIYDRTFHMSMIAGPAAASRSIPRVSTIVSPPEQALPLVEPRFTWLKKRRLAKAYRSSRQVVAVSEVAARSAESFYGLRLGSVRVIANPVDTERITTRAAEFQVTRPEQITVVSVGRLSHEKGQADLLDAIMMLEQDWPTDQDGICVWVIGAGPLRESLESKARLLRRHQVKFLGAQPNPLPYVRASDALVLPSHFEGLPNVVLEAMALERPVIATRAGGTVQLQKSEPTIFWADPIDPPSLAGAIDRFLNNREEAQRMIQSSLRLLDEHHRIEHAIDEIQELLANQ